MECHQERLLKSVASQLDTLKKLFEDGVLTPKEFEEQKGIIIHSGLEELCGSKFSPHTHIIIH